MPVDASPAPSHDALGSLASHASGTTRRVDLAVSAPSVLGILGPGQVPPQGARAFVLELLRGGAARLMLLQGTAELMFGREHARADEPRPSRHRGGMTS